MDNIQLFVLSGTVATLVGFIGEIHFAKQQARIDD